MEVAVDVYMGAWRGVQSRECYTRALENEPTRQSMRDTPKSDEPFVVDVGRSQAIHYAASGW